jgi:hypothetical protein
MERHNPSTSKEAYKSVSIEMLNNHHSKIIKALKELGSGTYEDIAHYLQWDDKNRASRRLLELERLEIVWKPGAKKPTKSGRQAFVYCLTNNMPRTEKQLPQELAYKKEDTSAADFANKIIQQSLFD